MTTATTVRERPIIMRAESVRAILDGRKTQTRRVVKLPNGVSHTDVLLDRMQHYPDGTVRPVWDIDGEPNAFGSRNPHGQPGDRLWVRETFDIRAGVPSMSRSASLAMHHRAYRADGGIAFTRWRSPIHMPRWASRLTLEITDVRVERLRSISKDDALAEGALPMHGPGTLNGEPAEIAVFDPLMAFSLAWDSINGKRAPWDSNPWVWALTFRVAV
jgi:hypothetical protein